MTATRRTRHAGRWTPDDRAASSWHYLPVDVPPGTRALEVQLSYERRAGVLDLGCIGPDGWRGWSGGARDRFVIGADAATPGYVSGPLASGEWQVVVGLHHVPPLGLGYEIDALTASEPIELASEAAALPKPDRPPRRDLPAPDGMRWLAGDFHAHTTHSDGAYTLDNLAVTAASRGLDFLAVTDHNTVSHHPHLAAAGRHAGIQLLPGQEVTTDSGHANAFGDIGWIDFRQPASDWLDTVTTRGGILSVNHPVGGDCAWRKNVAGPVAEIWHGSWRDRTDGAGLAWWAAHGHAQTPIGGSDWHGTGSDAPPGSPTTWVACADDDTTDDDTADVLAGVAAGRTAITAERNGPILLRVDDELIALDADGLLLRGVDGRRSMVHGDRVRFAGRPGPHVLESDTRAVLALCN